MKKIIFTILRVIITAGIFLFIFSKLSFNESINIIKESNLIYLSISFLCILALSFIIALRWHQILKPYNFKAGIFKTFRVYMIAFFFNNFLPSTVGMDTVRGMYIVNDRKRIADVISTIILERWIGLLGIIIYVSLIPILFYSQIEIKYFLYVSIAGIISSLIFVIAVWNTKVYAFFSTLFEKIKWLNLGNKINSLYNSLRLIRDHPHLFLVNLILSILIQILFVFSNYFIVLAQQSEISLLSLIVYVPLISVISMIPITINGLGLREWAYITFFGLVIKEQALSLALTFFILITLMSLIGGAIFIFERKKIKE